MVIAYARGAGSWLLLADFKGRDCSSDRDSPPGPARGIFMDNLVTSNIRQRPIRTLVSVAGIALGVSLVMLFTGLARGMSNDLQRRATNVRAELIFMRPGAVQLTSMTANLDTRYVDRLKTIEGVEDALPVIRHFFQGTSGIGIEQIDGVPWNAYASMNGLNLTAGQGPDNLNEVVIDET